MTGIDYEKAIVAFVCWLEAKDELYRGMISVAMALRNQAKAGWNDGSIYRCALYHFDEGVIFKDREMQQDYPDAREPQFQNLLTAMDGIFSDTLPDKTEGAVYWANQSSNFADVFKHERTLQVGQLIFFKPKRV